MTNTKAKTTVNGFNVETRESFIVGLNPYRQDSYNMGTSVGKNIEVLFSATNKEHAEYVIILDKYSGKRIIVTGFAELPEIQEKHKVNLERFTTDGFPVFKTDNDNVEDRYYLIGHNARVLGYSESDLRFKAQLENTSKEDMDEIIRGFNHSEYLTPIYK